MKAASDANKTSMGHQKWSSQPLTWRLLAQSVVSLCRNHLVAFVVSARHASFRPLCADPTLT
jgi:hypothetical protein